MRRRQVRGVTTFPLLVVSLGGGAGRGGPGGQRRSCSAQTDHAQTGMRSRGLNAGFRSQWQVQRTPIGPSDRHCTSLAEWGHCPDRQGTPQQTVHSTARAGKRPVLCTGKAPHRRDRPRPQWDEAGLVLAQQPPPAVQPICPAATPSSLGWARQGDTGRQHPPHPTQHGAPPKTEQGVGLWLPQGGILLRVDSVAFCLANSLSQHRPRAVLKGGGDPKFCVPKMAQQDFPNGTFHFFPRWSLWSGGGSRGGGDPPPCGGGGGGGSTGLHQHNIAVEPVPTGVG